MTGKFYSSDPAIRRKREMMTLWAGWLDEWRAKAIAADPVLSDREALVEAIYRERYSEEHPWLRGLRAWASKGLALTKRNWS